MNPECHPNRPYLANGLCKSCYNKKYFQSNKERYYQQGKMWRDKNKLKLRNKALKEKFGITLDDFNVLKEQQQFVCLICKINEATHVDHCHKTGKIRGLLCHGCNTAIGLVKENIKTLKNAIRYLNKNA